MTHPFPTRRSSDLAVARCIGRCRGHAVRHQGIIGHTLVGLVQGIEAFDGAEQLALAEANQSDTLGVAADLRHFRSEEHTSELQSLMRTSYAVFCLKKKQKHQSNTPR